MGRKSVLTKMVIKESTYRLYAILLTLFISWEESTVNSFRVAIFQTNTLSRVFSHRTDRRFQRAAFRTFRRSNVRLNIAPPPQDPSLTVVRVPLGKIFSGEREYCFSTRKNMRSYEWGNEEAEELYDDLKEEALKPDTDIREKDLGTIIILKSDWDKKTYGDGNLYDVHDGQQRLITLSLLLAAFRDVLENNLDAKDTVEELRAMLRPVKSRKEDILRVQMREKEGFWLKTILSKTETDEILLPATKARSKLPAPERHVIENYEFFVKCTKDLTVDEIYSMLDYMKENAFIMVSIPTDTRMARNMVMGQGKGKDTAPVDMFKAMVCFNSINDGAEQDAVLEQWDRLCDEAGGRKVLESACLLLAQAALGRRPQKNCEIDLMEDFLKADLLASGHGGRGFFEARIAPAVRLLKQFRDGALDSDLARDAGAGRPSLRFLRAACELQGSREIEMVVLQLLLRLAGRPTDAARDGCEARLRELERVALWMMLARPDVRARCARCFRMVRELQAGAGGEGGGEGGGGAGRDAEPGSAFALSGEEREAARRALDECEFGGSAPWRAAARAVLGRLNEHELLLHSQCDVQPQAETLQVEHVLPVAHQGADWMGAWAGHAPEAWVHRLGNLALLNQVRRGAGG